MSVLAREIALSESLYACVLVLMSKPIVALKNKFRKWKDVFESSSLKISLGKSKVMVSRGITNHGL